MSGASQDDFANRNEKPAKEDERKKKREKWGREGEGESEMTARGCWWATKFARRAALLPIEIGAAASLAFC